MTVPHCLDQCEESGRLANFDLAAGQLKEGAFRGRLYDDSDVFKLIEGAAYALRYKKDPQLERRIRIIIARIAAAQKKDGYLNSYYTTKKAGKRWTNLRGGHELYCAGHLIEAGIAWKRSTGDPSLLRVSMRFANLIDKVFGPGKRFEPPGHQEIELALFKLARETGERRYAKLALFFLEARGRFEGRQSYGTYAQDHLPVREQRKAEGHAVRNMYQSCALTDLAAEEKDKDLIQTLELLWDDVHRGKIYITGGIGSVPGIEGFGPSFVLPNDTAFTETCAAIALSLWNGRMLALTGKARYADDFERSLYNGILSGVSLGGDRFFYDNPLASRGGHKRSPWFSCACCPTNLARFLPSLGGRIFAYGPREIRVAQFIGSRASFVLAGGRVSLSLKSGLPWKGRVEIEFDTAKRQSFALLLREPAWCRGRGRLFWNGLPLESRAEKGWLRVEGSFAKGDRIELRLPMDIRRVQDDPRVQTNRGRVALQRGPLVFCFEGRDYGGHSRNLVLPKETELKAKWNPNFLGGVMTLEGKGLARQDDGSFTTIPLRAVPYFAWNNRGPGELVTWIPEQKDLAERPGQGLLLKLPDRELEASHCYSGDHLSALMDQKLPKNSSDSSIPRMTFWPLKGARGQIFCRFDKARLLDQSSVYWFDDRPEGGCRIPASYQLYYRDGDSWTPVQLQKNSSYQVVRDRFQTIRFTPAQAREWMLEIQMKKGFSTGLLEWRLGTEEK
jgi:DUF1680 family protein